MYNISFINLMMLMKCVPNYSYDKDNSSVSTQRGKNNKIEPPKFGQKGNIGSFDGLVSFFKGQQNK